MGGLTLIELAVILCEGKRFLGPINTMFLSVQQAFTALVHGVVISLMGSVGQCTLAQSPSYTAVHKVQSFFTLNLLKKNLSAIFHAEIPGHHLPFVIFTMNQTLFYMPVLFCKPVYWLKVMWNTISHIKISISFIHLVWIWYRLIIPHVRDEVYIVVW